LHALLGLKPSVRSVEDMNRTVAEFAATFIDHRPTPPAAEEGELVVLTGDGKGVVMRRPPVVILASLGRIFRRFEFDVLLDGLQRVVYFGILHAVVGIGIPLWYILRYPANCPSCRNARATRLR
jgi:hypothetical protein